MLNHFHIWRTWWPGLALLLAIALGVQAIAPWLRPYGLGVLTLSLLIGMLLGTFTPIAQWAPLQAGLRLAKTRLLRIGIVLFATRLQLPDLLHLGTPALLVSALAMVSTLGISWTLGRWLLRLPGHTVLLTAAGSSICGAAAIMATASIARSPERAIAQSMGVIVLFGTLAIALYPLLFHLFGYDATTMHTTMGVITGATVHEIAQVVAIGHTLGETGLQVAVLSKMSRVLLLMPFLWVLVALVFRKAPTTQASTPWFALVFIVVVVLNSLWPLPTAWHALRIDEHIMAVAMVAIGLSTSLGVFRHAGLKPLLLGALIFAWLIAFGFGIAPYLL